MPTYTAKYLITDVIPPPYVGGPFNKTTINIAGHDWTQVGYETTLNGINKYVLQGLVDVSTLVGNERYAHFDFDPPGTTFYSYYNQVINDINQIPAQYILSGSGTTTLADGWTGSNDTATSGDFSWTSPSTATYNLKTSLSLPGYRDLLAYGLDYAVKYVGGEAATAFGVKPLWDAVKRDGAVSTALTNFVNSGANTLTQLLNGFNTGMTPEQADARLQTFMDNAAFNFHQAGEKVLGTGTGNFLKVTMEGLRLTEKWAVNPSTGAITHSEVGVEDGAHTGYFGQYAQFTGDPSYRNDVVLSGDSSDSIDTGYDTGFTPRAQIDFIAAGGGADVIQSHEGADVIAAGFGNDRIIAGPGNDYIDGGRGFDTAYYTGVMSNYSIAHNANGSWIVTDNRPGSPDGTDTLISIEQLMFANGAANPLYAQNQSITIATPPPIQQDFNGDGHSDILWQNTNGQAEIWEMRGGKVIGMGPTGPNPGRAWKAVGTGDFNGDGYSDMLWQNTNGQAEIWELMGRNVISMPSVGPNPGRAWKAVGTGDFNGDGLADILWQNTNGQAEVWEMNGAKVIGMAPTGPNPGPAWKAIGTGDFNDDGHSDILWQNTNGQAEIWEMNGAKVIGMAPTGPNPGKAWKAIGTGDFNDDGHSDILWQNIGGQAEIWKMNGAKVIGMAPVGPNPGPSWKAIGTRDFNGDGHSDILWQNIGGQAEIWEMNGAKVIGMELAGPNPGPSWHAVKT
jgi:FG-GAP-like repeat/RTX calcium-binding nonapeptide repeat (4 copies)